MCLSQLGLKYQNTIENALGGMSTSHCEAEEEEPAKLGSGEGSLPGL